MKNLYFNSDYMLEHIKEWFPIDRIVTVRKVNRWSFMVVSEIKGTSIIARDYVNEIFYTFVFNKNLCEWTDSNRNEICPQITDGELYKIAMESFELGKEALWEDENGIHKSIVCEIMYHGQILVRPEWGPEDNRIGFHFFLPDYRWGGYDFMLYPNKIFLEGVMI